MELRGVHVVDLLELIAASSSSLRAARGLFGVLSSRACPFGQICSSGVVARVLSLKSTNDGLDWTADLASDFLGLEVKPELPVASVERGQTCRVSRKVEANDGDKGAKLIPLAVIQSLVDISNIQAEELGLLGDYSRGQLARAWVHPFFEVPETDDVLSHEQLWLFFGRLREGLAYLARVDDVDGVELRAGLD